MASSQIITGVDVGTHKVRVVVCEAAENGRMPRIITTAEAPSQGLRHGYIVNVEGAAKAIRLALRRAQHAAGVTIQGAYFSAGGIGLEGATVTGTALVSQAEGEVDTSDCERARASAEKNLGESENKKILQAVPLSYQLDGKTVLGRPEGMNGMKLAAKVLVIRALSQHIDDLVSAADMADIEVLDVLPAPIAASCVTLDGQQKTAGCVLTNIGSETISIVVFEDNLPVSLEVFSVGSTDITNDIALGMQVPLEHAEKLKLGKTAPPSGKKKLDEIIKKRLEDVFKLIEAHLDKIGRSRLLPAGIIITGGGSGIATLEDMAKASLELPSSTVGVRTGQQKNQSGNDRRSQNTFKNAPSWAVAYGLCVLGVQSGEDEGVLNRVREFGSGLKNTASGLLKKFLP